MLEAQGTAQKIPLFVHSQAKAKKPCHRVQQEWAYHQSLNYMSYKLM